MQKSEKKCVPQWLCNWNKAVPYATVQT